MSTMTPTHISLSPNPPRSEDGKYLAACGKELTGVVPYWDDAAHYMRRCRECDNMVEEHGTLYGRSYFTFFVRAPKQEAE